jgi:predicted molibdopterin-dependent oxidoreductase YjgC
MNDTAFRSVLEEKWNVNDLPQNTPDVMKLISDKAVRNLFIFGEDPLGCATGKDPKNWIGNAEFVMVQDYFMTPTAAEANLILPASFPAETGGSYTNTQKVIQEFDALMQSKTELTNLDQLACILKSFGFPLLCSPKDIFMEFISLLPGAKDHSKLMFRTTGSDDLNRVFDSGCDAVGKRFDDEFEHAFDVN